MGLGTFCVLYGVVLTSLAVAIHVEFNDGVGGPFLPACVVRAARRTWRRLRRAELLLVRVWAEHPLLGRLCPRVLLKVVSDYRLTKDRLEPGGGRRRND